MTPALGSLLVSLAALPPEGLEATLTHLALAFSTPVAGQQAIRTVYVTTPDINNPVLSGHTFGNLRLVPYSRERHQSVRSSSPPRTISTPSRIAQDNQATACLMLGAEAHSLSIASIRALAAAVLDLPQAPAPDLAVPRYDLGPNEGLVNSANPLSRHPCSIRSAASLCTARRSGPFHAHGRAALRRRPTLHPPPGKVTPSYGQSPKPLQPTLIYTRSRLVRAPSHSPRSGDLNALLAQIAGSFFADIDVKASFWQRVRATQPSRPVSAINAPPEGWPDVTPMLEAFRLAYTNLADIWALVLRPTPCSA